MEQFDLFIIGGGPGGYEAALEAAKLGKSVALAEDRLIGGTCLNRGCIPTKALLRSAGLYSRLQREGAELGVFADRLRPDLKAMLRHAAAVEAPLRDGITGLLDRAGVRIIPARAEITEPGHVRAGNEVFSAGQILLATGSRPGGIPVPGADLPGVVTSDELLCGEGLDCERLAIVGGGVIGAEFAQIYSDLGKQVTILEAMPRILPKMDRELGQSLAQSFRKRGIGIHTGAVLQQIVRDEEGLILTWLEKDQRSELRADAVLIAVGRRPNTENLLPESMLFILDRGFVRADGNGKTEISGLYAAGDLVLGSPQLAYTAAAQGIRAVRSMFGAAEANPETVVPVCVFTDPEIASAGLTQEDAKHLGIPVVTKKNLTSANGKSLVEGSDRGFARLVFSAENGKLLGAQLMCAHASEMIGELASLIAAGADRDLLETTLWPHPTVSEILKP